jgi:hypothetical protein
MLQKVIVFVLSIQKIKGCMDPMSNDCPWRPLKPNEFPCDWELANWLIKMNLHVKNITRNPNTIKE